MLYLVIFLIIIAILTAVLFFLKINAVIEYVRNNNDDNIVISFYMMQGIFKYKYEIPLVDMGKNEVKFRLVREHGKKDKKISEKHERIKISEIYDKIIYIKNYYGENKDFICDLRDYIKKRFTLAEFNLNIKEGTGDAFFTGITCGILWSLVGMLSVFLTNSFNTFKKCISINPSYNSSLFNVDLFCIFHAKLVHIIVLIMKLRFNNNKNNKEKREIAKKIGGDLSG